MALKVVLGFFVLNVCADAQVSDIEQMTRVSSEFFDCCETGKGWAGCSKFVTDEDAPFSIEAVDALPGPPVTDAKSVKDYLDWMAGVVEKFGAKASYEVKAHEFNQTSMTAMYYAVFMGYSDYVYIIEMCPKELKVSGLRKVWNDQYAFDNIPGAAQQIVLAAKQATVDVHGADFKTMTRRSQEFFDCCETGKGWAGCSKFVSNEDAPFSIGAVDALPGPPVTDAKSVKDYLEWMAGVVHEFGARASYEVKAQGFDQTTMTVMYYAVFMGYSDYVYMIKMCPKDMKVCGMRKVWNDQYAFDNIPGATQQGTLKTSTPKLHEIVTSLCAVVLFTGAVTMSYATLKHRQREVHQPVDLLG